MKRQVKLLLLCSDETYKELRFKADKFMGACESDGGSGGKAPCHHYDYFCNNNVNKTR